MMTYQAPVEKSFDENTITGVNLTYFDKPKTHATKASYRSPLLMPLSVSMVSIF
ncbi:hypothetical protein [Pseudoalteromonas aurantia]|uniref:hypothetical protein n=1 Tax=Pseudoalteromonas aurantia TaxID=43654 RepID=UPI001485EBCB|nr:hypothetical protein [Pseudoalteromonas aurantia]